MGVEENTGPWEKQKHVQDGFTVADKILKQNSTEVQR